MVVFAQSDYFKNVALAICAQRPDCNLGELEILRYPNGEMYTQTTGSVQDQDCVICGSIAPPDAQMLSLLNLCDALKLAGAKSVALALPYLAYARHDKPAKGQSAGTALVGSLLRAAGVDRILTIDVHSGNTCKIMRLPIASLPATQLFLPYIKELGWRAPAVAAPDKGALGRARLLAQEIPAAKIIQLVKKHVDGTMHADLIGDPPGERVILVDDILDTGDTLISACQMLRRKGAKEFVAVVTHGLFSGDTWTKLFDLGVTKIFVTDTCPQAAAERHAGVHVLPSALVMAEGLKELS